jgi:hypothetical protein
MIPSAEDDRDRSIVDELDAHPGAEHACRDRDSEGGERGARPVFAQEQSAA